MPRDQALFPDDIALLLEQKHYIEKIREINESANEFHRPRRAFVHTYGCQQNVSDSERIKGLLSEMGYEFSARADDADLVIYNTCAVREHAEQRVFGNVGALKPIKVRRPDMIIGLCGCMMQQEHVAEKIKASYPFVDLVFGTGVLHRLPEFLYQVLADGKRVINTDESDGVIAEGIPRKRDNPFKAWLPVIYGCNNFCSYCVVPYVRGRERSRQPEVVLREAEELIRSGYKDITLLGQNVNSYGKDLNGDYNFSRLLREINAMKGDFRLRFMTSHPKDATRELFETIADCKKVERHLHLPFQAGSNAILKRMNRRYTKEDYLALVGTAREIIPGLSLTSDIIVGFPGETYEDFRETLDVVKRVEFENLFTFIYSKRKGTPAMSMPDPIDYSEKVKWFEDLLEAQHKITKKKMDQYVGSVQRVLCEGPGKTGRGYMTGRTTTDIIVDFQAGEDLSGRFVNIKISQALNFMLLGEAVN